MILTYAANATHKRSTIIFQQNWRRKMKSVSIHLHQNNAAHNQCGWSQMRFFSINFSTMSFHHQIWHSSFFFALAPNGHFKINLPFLCAYFLKTNKLSINLQIRSAANEYLTEKKYDKLCTQLRVFCLKWILTLCLAARFLFWKWMITHNTKIIQFANRQTLTQPLHWSWPQFDISVPIWTTHFDDGMYVAFILNNF